jgi:SAM-dependent methyltransferase
MHAGYRWEFDYVATKLGVADHVGEIGCGTGVFLEKCVARKADAFGVDFSESSVARCHEKGLSAALIKVGQDEISLPGSRNVIASFHVLEHLPDPGNLFTLASRCASPEATLWVAVPSDRRVDRLFCRKDLLDEPPHHLTKWTPAALRSIGHRNGWAMRQVIYEAMPLRQRLWTICRATTVYRQLAAQLGADANSGGRERLLRFALYPFVLTWHWRRVIRLTGASMLAEFCRSPITCSH